MTCQKKPMKNIYSSARAGRLRKCSGHSRSGTLALGRAQARLTLRDGIVRESTISVNFYFFSKDEIEPG